MMLLDHLRKDLRYGARQLVRAPGFTLAAILALGLGVGATTAIFSVLDAVVLRPLPYAQPDRLVTLLEANRARGLDRQRLSPVNFMDYRGLSHVFTDAAAWWRPNLTLTGEGQEPLRINAIETSTNLFAVLGVRAAVGPGFPEAGAFYANVFEVVISDRLWRSRFNADPSLVGRTIRIDNQAYTVLGVMPQGFHFPEDTDLWKRVRWDYTQHSRAAHFMEGIARLRDGIPLERAQAELNALTTRLASQHAATNGGWTTTATLLHVEVVGFFRPALYLLLGAVSLLLVIACVNVAGLLLARSTVREREMALRAAIGATRARLVRQLLTESGLLAGAGALVGTGLALAGVRLLVHATPVPIPRLDQVGVDARVLAFAVLVAAATAIGFGLLPALFLSRVNSQQTLKESTRTTSSRAREQTRRLLVMSEIGLAVTLLFGAGLLIRTVTNLAHEDAGVRHGAALTASVQIPIAGYPKYPQVAAFYGALLDRLRQSPELDAAGATNFLPLAQGWRVSFTVVGRPVPAAGEEPRAQQHAVSEGYFEAIGATILSGRSFEAHDIATTEPVLIINRTLARQQFANEDPIGKMIPVRMTSVGPLGGSVMKQRDFRIIGVVSDIKNSSLQTPAEPAFYTAIRQYPFYSLFVTVRGRADTARLTAIVRDAVRAIDPAVPLSNVKTMETVMGGSVSQLRLLTYLMGGFAALALLLAVLGIYGMLAYAVSQRQQEISIRLALGASRAGVLWLVLRQGLTLAAVGVTLGAAGGLLLSRSMATLLYGVRAGDALTLAAVAALVLAVAAAACLIPARRASTLEPLAGLRGE